MIKINLDKTYSPKDIEGDLYKHWEDSGYFKPSGDKSKPSYCIVIPPPNVTGSLHMGHAFQQTIMDALIRYHRMKGDNTLWQSGTDHAGIATQMVVERKVAAEENKTRHDYGRDAFIEKIWEWKAESGGSITKQMRRLGDSVDWDRDRFTMDADLVNAVQEVFVRLHEEGLIYRGKRLVNWDPKLKTAISDLEVENKPSKGSMWYVRYELEEGATTAEGKSYLVVATTRPETLLGDTAVAVNPEDPRYAALIGKKVRVPLIDRFIPIVGDEHADMTKGTGCVKITPAHDFNDYEVGKRHQLPMISVLDFDANLRKEMAVYNSQGELCKAYSSQMPEKYQGLERFQARKQMVAELDALGVLEKIEPHDLTVPYGDRGGVVIEPMLTDQWYVKTKPLAEVAIDAVKSGEIEFVPKQYENMYFSWMNDIQDWCISRQLWWGHRIPAWYDEAGNVYVGRSEEEVRRKNQLSASVQLTQDEDVLDTWFSSALWTFSTLGWPNHLEDLKTYHPTNVLVTGFDIIFFWVARMIMMTMHFIKDENGKPQVPFKTVYVTGLIRDDEGQKMSKSKGNVIDPLDMIDGISLPELLEKRTGNMMQPQLAEKIKKRTKKQFPNGIEPHGTDALRITLTALASTGRDINWDLKRLEGYRNFCNKLWNASRYVLMNCEGAECGFEVETTEYSLADRWILTQYHQTVKTYHEAFATYRFDLATQALYEFVWNQFCDWYLELTKITLASGTEAQKCGTRHTLIRVLESVLRLAHPIMPFITEAIWQNVKPIARIHADTIMLQPLPKAADYAYDEIALTEIEWLKEVIIAVRNVRSEMNIAPSKPLILMIRNHSPIVHQIISTNSAFLRQLAKLDEIQFLGEHQKAPLSVTKLVNSVEMLIPMADLINKEEELKRLQKEMDRLDAEIKHIADKLANASFVDKAPKAVVEKEQEKQAQYQQDKQKLQEQYLEIETL